MIIEGDNVRLRPATPDDRPAYTRWYTDPEFRRYLGNGDGTLQMVTSPRPDAVTFSVEEKDGTLAGLIFVCHIRTESRHCEIGPVGIGDPARRDKGLGTEMTELALGFCFDELNMHQVHIVTTEFNERARACYAKLFPRQQVHREQVWADGRFWDEIYFDITEEEWAARA